MYLGQYVGDVKIKQIKQYFDVNHIGVVSLAIQAMKLLFNEDKSVKVLHKNMLNHVNIVQKPEAINDAYFEQ